jgi:hypothetical protein
MMRSTFAVEQDIVDTVCGARGKGRCRARRAGEALEVDSAARQGSCRFESEML